MHGEILYHFVWLNAYIRWLRCGAAVIGRWEVVVDMLLLCLCVCGAEDQETLNGKRYCREQKRFTNSAGQSRLDPTWLRMIQSLYLSRSPGRSIIIE